MSRWQQYRVHRDQVRVTHSLVLQVHLRHIFSDVNDSPPRFESSVHNVTLAENNLHSQERSSGSFRLDRNIGVLTLAQALDYERHKSYQLHVVVIDRQVNPVRDSCTVNISVLDHSPSTKMRFNPIFEHDQDGTMAYVKGSFDIHLLSAFVNVHDEDEGGHGQVGVLPLFSGSPELFNRHSGATVGRAESMVLLGSPSTENRSHPTRSSCVLATSIRQLCAVRIEHHRRQRSKKDVQDESQVRCEREQSSADDHRTSVRRRFRSGYQ